MMTYGEGNGVVRAAKGRDGPGAGQLEKERNLKNEIC